MAFTTPTTDDFRAQFARDFPFAPAEGGGTPPAPGSDKAECVTDADLRGAILDAQAHVNQDLFGTQASYSRAFLFLAAHNLVQNLLAAGSGVRAAGDWLTTGKSVGDLAESYAIPKQILEDPFLAILSKTRYGMRYLQLVVVFAKGNMMATFRQTLP